MSFTISSVKISAKIKEISLNDIKEKCLNQNINCSTYNNFVVFRLPNFTYIIFKKRLLKNCEKDSCSLQHANITVKSIHEIQEAIDVLRKILKYESSENIPFKIDNLTATSSIGKQVNVDLFLKATRHISDKVSVYKGLGGKIFSQCWQFRSVY